MRKFLASIVVLTIVLTMASVFSVSAAGEMFDLLLESEDASTAVLYLVVSPEWECMDGAAIRFDVENCNITEVISACGLDLDAGESYNLSTAADPIMPESGVFKLLKVTVSKTDANATIKVKAGSTICDGFIAMDEITATAGNSATLELFKAAAAPTEVKVDTTEEDKAKYDTERQDADVVPVGGLYKGIAFAKTVTIAKPVTEYKWIVKSDDAFKATKKKTVKGVIEAGSAVYVADAYDNGTKDVAGLTVQGYDVVFKVAESVLATAGVDEYIYTNDTEWHE